MIVIRNKEGEIIVRNIPLPEAEALVTDVLGEGHLARWVVKNVERHPVFPFRISDTRHVVRHFQDLEGNEKLTTPVYLGYEPAER